MLQPSRAPGRDSPGAPPPPPADAPADGAKTGSQAPAAPPGDPGPFGGMGLMLPMLLVVFGLFFFMNRNEKKRRQKLEEGFKKGDKVITRAGFIAKLVEVGDTRVKVELAPGVNVTMLKTAIEGPADDDKPKDDKPKDPKELKEASKDQKDGKDAKEAKPDDEARSKKKKS
jgi:preprotein translocase subunit YajC